MTWAEPAGAVWRAHPTALALAASRRHRDEGAGGLGAFCAEVGRRLLLAELEFSDWILRRVEKIALQGDRGLSRQITVEFAIRADAPAYLGSDGTRLRLVPLSLMRRRTLVNLDIRDDDGKTLAMPGMRLTQQLDESIVLAAIAAARPELAADQDCRDWVHQAISGRLADVLAAYDSLDGKPGSKPAPFLDELRSVDLFMVTINQFRTNFTLYVFVPEQGEDQRLIRIGFEEPIRWQYRTPHLAESGTRPGSWDYRSDDRRAWPWQRALAALGIEPIRMRLQVPGAAHASSFHFEMTAPPGVQIVGATLLAGRPNDREEEGARVECTVDAVERHAPSVGLHGVEIPSMSLCRVQVDLRPLAEGWLATMLVACVVICAALGSVAYQWWDRNPLWDKDQITNIIVLLVAVSAGVTTLVAQRPGADFANRFFTAARALGTLAMALPIAIAGLLVYAALAPGRHGPGERWGVLLLCAASVIPLVTILLAWAASLRAGGRGSEIPSPWDMTDRESARKALAWQAEGGAGFGDRVHRYGFDKPAVGVESAEGWHESYTWTRSKQKRAVDALEASGWPFPIGRCARLGTACKQIEACPDG